MTGGVAAGREAVFARGFVQRVAVSRDKREECLAPDTIGHININLDRE